MMKSLTEIKADIKHMCAAAKTAVPAIIEEKIITSPIKQNNKPLNIKNRYSVLPEAPKAPESAYTKTNKEHKVFIFKGLPLLKYRKTPTANTVRKIMYFIANN